MKSAHLQKFLFTTTTPITITQKRAPPPHPEPAPLTMLNTLNNSYTNTQSIAVKKIVSVYQINYKDCNVYGFGDFIRGCFFLMSMCEKMGLLFDIDLSNHLLSKYVEGHIKNPNINYNNISNIPIDYVFDKSHNFNYKSFKRFIENEKDEVYYTSSNIYPLFGHIKQSHINFIKSRIMPNAQMQKEIYETMTTLNLNNSRFSVIHVRAGDKFIFDTNNVVEKSILNNLFYNLKLLLNDKGRKYLILSDCANLKMWFKPYDNCVFQMNQIAHLGEQPVLIEDDVQNTMMDFYLMSRAAHIYAYSTYPNFSGFSKWCAIIYNIPYKWHQIK
jgi:hypothetical protein